MTSETDRLRLLHDFTRHVTTATDIEGLLREATRRGREIYGAEGCALLLLDEDRNEFTFPVASQRESVPVSADELAEIRFPADRGIAGWVLANDEPALVTDVDNDPRFYDGVDEVTHMKTYAILCAPLRTRSGNIGVVEVVNPVAEALTESDLEFLETLASDISLAYEKAVLYESLRGEVVSLQRFFNLVGLGLVILGVVIVGSSVLSHLARALPLIELLLHPGVLAGLATAALGGVLIAGARLRRGVAAP